MFSIDGFWGLLKLGFPLCPPNHSNTKALPYSPPVMAYRKRSKIDAIISVFTLSPLPYPVLFILAVLFIFLAISWSSEYESAVESTEESLGWVIKASPVILLIMVHWLSTIENPEWLFARSPHDQRRMTHHRPSEGTSPWVVALVIVLLLVMVSYQSSFHDSWFG